VEAISANGWVITFDRPPSHAAVEAQVIRPVRPHTGCVTLTIASEPWGLWFQGQLA
jgi:hypothetical protein